MHGDDSWLAGYLSDLRVPSGSKQEPTITRNHMLEVGTQAPDFTVQDHTGTETKLSDERGKWVLLWWYPKADTPG
jgi:peroxiredoxin